MGDSDRLHKIFLEQPLAELSTTEIVKLLYPKDYQHIKSALYDPLADKESLKIAKRRKGQLHRKALYHINRLIDQSIITITQHQAKGEKIFSLRHQELAQKSKAQHEPLPVSEIKALSHLEQYEREGIIAGFDSAGWHNRLNAVLLELRPQDRTEHLYERITTVSDSVNDALGIYGFEQLINNEDLQSMTSFLKRLDIDTRDNGKYVTFIIQTEQIKNEQSCVDFFTAFRLIDPERVSVILQIKKEFLIHPHRMFGSIINECSSNGIKINIQDLDKHNTPMIIGRGGVYTISQDEWNIYQEEVRGDTIGLCFSQLSVAIDMKRFFALYKTPSAFREFVLKVARSLVEASTQQRRHADVSYRMINNLNDTPHEFYRFAINYIRLWNYNWSEDEQPHLLEILNSAAQEINDFCHTEEAIFKSCGIPIRFRISLSSAFHKFKKDFFSARAYQKVTIKNKDDFEKDDIKEYFMIREKTFNVFNNADRLRIFRSVPVSHQDIISELLYLSKEFHFPLICYDFAKRQEHMTLDNYI